MNYIPQEQYDFIIQNMPIACVDVCIICDRGVLLVKRNTEPMAFEWCIPGGRLYKGEKLIDCAKRKCIEEVGIESTIGPIIHTDETIFNTGPGGIPIHSINCVFLAIPSHYNVKLDKYSSDFKWINTIDNSLHPYVKQCIFNCGIR